MYWQAAGKDYDTGKKSKLMTNFEEKYKKKLIDHMIEFNTVNLWTKFKQLPQDYQQNIDLVNAMRHYDQTVNVSWTMHHLNAAKKYLGDSEATGGSDWQKYMHPKYQRRIFFPGLWSQEELDGWGIDNLDGCKVLTELHSKLS